MAFKINGLGANEPLPNINKRKYVHCKYTSPTLEAVLQGGARKVVTIQTAISAAWNSVVERSKLKPCNECFKKLPKQKSLADILKEGDIIINSLKPKPTFTDADLPYGNTAERSIGLHPALFFDPDPLYLPCTLIHEIAHIGGATSDSDAPKVLAHAAEATLPPCKCENQYDDQILGSIKLLRPQGPAGPRYA